MQDLNLDKDTRNYLAVWALLAVLVAVMAWWVPTGPWQDYIDARDELENAQQDLQLAQLALIEEDERLARQKPIVETLATRPGNFNFFTFLDSKVKQSNLSERATLNNVRRSARDTGIEELVEVEFSPITLEELVAFLHEVYDANNLVAVYQVNHLRPARDNRGLECMMTFVTLKP